MRLLGEHDETGGLPGMAMDACACTAAGWCGRDEPALCVASKAILCALSWAPSAALDLRFVVCGLLVQDCSCRQGGRMDVGCTRAIFGLHLGLKVQSLGLVVGLDITVGSAPAGGPELCRGMDMAMYGGSMKICASILCSVRGLECFTSETQHFGTAQLAGLLCLWA